MFVSNTHGTSLAFDAPRAAVWLLLPFIGNAFVMRRQTAQSRQKYLTGGRL
jgi:hypothetical protein